MEISNSIRFDQSIQSSVEIAGTGPINKDIDLGIKVNLKQSMKEDVRERTKEDIDIGEIENMINQSNKQMLIYDRRLDISIHQKTKEVMVKVIDVGTDEVIREIPPEKVLDIRAKLVELRGIMLDEKV